MCRMDYYFLTVKCKYKHREDVTASLATKRNERYNTPISLNEIRLYLEIPATIENIKLMIYSQSDIL